MLATKPKDPSLIPGTYVNLKQELTSVSCPLTSAHVLRALPPQINWGGDCLKNNMWAQNSGNIGNQKTLI